MVDRFFEIKISRPVKQLLKKLNTDMSDDEADELDIVIDNLYGEFKTAVTAEDITEKINRFDFEFC